MDARTGVERQPQSNPARIAAGKSRSSSDGAVAIADAAIAWEDHATRATEGGQRVSPDPMRATDRYRLVMPYSARV